jgi:hypothetical protein
MPGENPYQASELPVEQHGDPDSLPSSSYVSAGCSAAFVFVGGALVGLFLLSLVLPLRVTLFAAPLLALAMAAVSAWETLRLERRKRRERMSK